MSYGLPSPSGHGHRATHYVWAPAFTGVPRRIGRSSRGKVARAKSFQAARRLNRRGAPRHTENRLAAALLSLGGRRSPDWYLSSVGALLWAGILIHSLPLLCAVVAWWVLKQTEGIPKTAIKDALRCSDACARSIRAKRKSSAEPPPTPEGIRAAWRQASNSLAGKLLAGTLLSNLEPVVDQSYIRGRNGEIVGRRGGIKRWLAENCPDMLPHYKALMSYKALTDKLRAALGVEEPDTLSGVLDFGSQTQGEVPGKEGVPPKSLKMKSDVRMIRSNVVYVTKNMISLFRDMGWGEEGEGTGGATGKETAAALERAVKERLGIVGMQRTRRRKRAA